MFKQSSNIFVLKDICVLNKMKYVKIKLPKKVNSKDFFNNLNLNFIYDQSKNPSGLYSGEKKLLFGVTDGRVNPNPHPPDLKDLLFLYQLITLNKRNHKGAMKTLIISILLYIFHMVYLKESIYDVYFISRRDPEREVEIKVAHYWFNGDVGSQIQWVAEKPYTDWSKVECS